MKHGLLGQHFIWNESRDEGKATAIVRGVSSLWRDKAICSVAEGAEGLLVMRMVPRGLRGFSCARYRLVRVQLGLKDILALSWIFCDKIKQGRGASFVSDIVDKEKGNSELKGLRIYVCPPAEGRLSVSLGCIIPHLLCDFSTCLHLCLFLSLSLDTVFALRA